jgi:predicted transcriptional regulator
MPALRRHMWCDLLTVEAALSVIEVAQRMVERNVGAVLVLEDGRLAGIMTERDLMRAVARGLRDDAVVAEDMTADPETIAPDDTTEHAAVLMIHGGFRHLPVVDGEEVVGVLSIRDVGAGRARGRCAARCMSVMHRRTGDPDARRCAAADRGTGLHRVVEAQPLGSGLYPPLPGRLT